MKAFHEKCNLIGGVELFFVRVITGAHNHHEFVADVNAENPEKIDKKLE